MIQMRWYFRPITVVIAILCVGPLALPLLWVSPAFKKWQKVVISVLVLALTVALAKAMVLIYREFEKQLALLKEIL